jgi:hypothetical protein
MTKYFSQLAIGLATTVFMIALPLVVAAQTAPPPAPTSSSDAVQKGLDAIKSPFPENLQGNNSTTLGGAAVIVINWALGIAGLTAVIFIIIGGYYFITARGNEEQAKQGRKTLVNAVIGLIIVVVSFLIVQIVYRFITQDWS